MFSRMHLWYLLFSVDVIYIPMVWKILCQLSSSHDNSQSRVIYHSCKKHAPSVVIITWQRSEYDYTLSRMSHALSVAIISWQRPEHGYSSLGMKYAPSVVIVSWQRWEHGNISYIFKNMPCKLSSPHDNGQSMVIHPKDMNHAPQVVFISHYCT